MMIQACSVPLGLSGPSILVQLQVWPVPPESRLDDLVVIQGNFQLPGSVF